MPIMKKAVFVVGILFVIGGIGYVLSHASLLHDLEHLWEHQTERFTSTDEAISDEIEGSDNFTGLVYTVTYTTTGYNPSRLQIEL